MRRVLLPGVLVLGLAAMASATGQEVHPTEECRFDGARADAAIRRLAGKDFAPYYFACQENNPNAHDSGCIKGILTPPLIVTVDRELAGWSCVTDGDTSGWVETWRLSDLPTEPRPRQADWVGWWSQSRPVAPDDNVLLLTPGTRPGSLRVSGRAFWHGLGDNVHFGQVNGEAVPIGNLLRVIEYNCVLDLILTVQKGVPELQGRDNRQCGGMNVSFRGNWRKFVPRPVK